MSVDSERHRRLMELFDEAVLLPASERWALAARVAAEDAALGAELVALLAEDGRHDDFLHSLNGRVDATGLAHEWQESDAHGAGTDCEAPDPYLDVVIAGRYRIEALLGSGSMGRVYRAFDTTLERMVAVKLLRSNLMDNARQVMRFRREFRAISRLDHPGCVSVFEEGLHREQRYMVMEYVAGGNLERLAGATETVLLPVLIQLAAALAYVHGRRIVHRDLKPANVLLTPGERPRPKLADFGIVRLTDDLDSRLTDTDAILGTPDYLAPEQLEGHVPDPRSDLYALGCVIYQLWAGRPPFLGSSFQRLRARMESDAPRLRSVAPHAPEAIESLTARLLHRNPAERPQRAGEVVRALEEYWNRHEPASGFALSSGIESDDATIAYLYQPDLMGRDGTLAALGELIESVASGASSTLIAVRGPAGLGKSALMAEFARRSNRQGGRVVTVSCRGTEHTPFAPFPAVLAALDQAPTVSARQDPGNGGVRLNPSNGEGRLHSARFPVDEAVIARRRLARKVAGRLRELQARARVVLVVEDFHLIKSENAWVLLGELLTQLDRVGEHRPVVVVTLRPQESEAFAVAFRDRSPIALIELESLGRQAVEQIAAAMLAVEASAVPPSLIPYLMQSSAGNPLLVQSALRTLVDRGQLRLTAFGWILAPDARADGGPRAPVRERLTLLGARTQEILAVAAVCGQRFDIELVSQVAGVGHDAVIDAVDEAIRAAVVQPAAGRSAHDEYAFEHELLAESLREHINAEQRARLHEAIGLALMQRDQASPSMLAFHFRRSNDGARAFHYLRQAAVLAIDACDYGDAQYHLRLALERVGSLPKDTHDAARDECTELLADALIMTGEHREGVEMLRRLPAAAAALTTRARRLRKMGFALARTASIGEGLILLQQALMLLGDGLPRGHFRVYWRILCELIVIAVNFLFRHAPQPDEAMNERALLHRELGFLHRWINLERSFAHWMAYIRLAQRLGIPAYRVEMHAGTAFFCSLWPWPRLATWSHDQAQRLALTEGDLHGLARIACAVTAAHLGHDEDIVFAHCREGLRIAEHIGDRFLINFVLSRSGWCAGKLGHARQAIEDFDRAYALATELGIPWLRADAAYGRSWVELYHGQPNSAVATARQILGSEIHLDLPVFEGIAQELLGYEAFVNGRFYHAAGYFERAWSSYKTHRLHRGWGTLTQLLYGEALLCLVDTEGPQTVHDLVRTLRHLARRWRRLGRLPAFRGCDLLLRGIYQSRRGNERAARSLFSRVRSIREGSGQRVTYLDLWCRARMVLEGWHLGDSRAVVSAALDELDEQYRSFGASGMRAWLRHMRDMQRI